MFRRGFFLGRNDSRLPSTRARKTWPQKCPVPRHVFGFLLQLADLRELPLGGYRISHGAVQTRQPVMGVGLSGIEFLRTQERGEGFRIFFLIGENGADVQVGYANVVPELGGLVEQEKRFFRLVSL